MVASTRNADRASGAYRLAHQFAVAQHGRIGEREARLDKPGAQRVQRIGEDRCVRRSGSLARRDEALGLAPQDQRTGLQMVYLGQWALSQCATFPSLQPLYVWA